MPSHPKTSPDKSSVTATTEAASVTGETAAPIPLAVGIGASAGGLEALEHFFAVMPPDCGLSYVVIMHLLPEGPAFLPALLHRYTAMAVVTAEEGMPLAANTVHVLTGGRDLTLENGHFKVAEPAPALRPHHPIDRFFASLAQGLAERAVAVVLSGSGTDGAAGVKKIREAGGIVLVQDPESAISPGMPRSAIATGAADFVLSTEQLPEKITEIAHGTCTLPPRSCRTNTLEEELQTICALVKTGTSHDFSSYKANTVLRRIERRMAVHETGGFGKYIALLREDPLEAKALCQDILIGVTSFFRDPEAFAILRQNVIPRLFTDRNPDEPVRIWHACCATGEEVYSTAMLICEYLDEQKIDIKVQIFATDIDETAIAQARAGLYPDDISVEVGEERLKRFFTRVDHRWQVAKGLREMIVFAHHNLLKDPPFSRLNLLVCRNFLIYLNPDMQRRLIPLFHQVLKPAGVLFLGSAETLGRHAELFTPVDKKWKIFKQRERRDRGESVFPFTASIRRPPGIIRPAQAGDERTGPGAVAEKLLMKRYAPPCVVVNEKYEVVYVSTRMGRFLELPVGEPTRDILKMAREELRPPLRAAIFKAFAEEQEVIFRGVKVAMDGGEVTVNVQVEPLHAPPYGKLAMVVFAPAPAAVAMTAPCGTEEGSGDDTSRETLIRQLEEQLRITHEQLQAVTEQLESSHEGFMAANEELISMNEEFQSANEELQSANEELETSKEELQALNEELATLNGELQGKVEELDQTNNDIENLLASAEIATLFLDQRLTIKRFTPAMAVIFDLIPADIGRPFRHLTGTIDWPEFQRDVIEVLEKLHPIEREVTAPESERHYLLRVLPYLGSNGISDGVVVTLVDITAHKRAEECIIHLASFPQLNPNPVVEVDSSGNVIFFNPATQSVLERLGKQGADAALFLPADLDDILESWDKNNEVTLQREVVIAGMVFGETIFLTPQLNVARIYAFDLTERKRAEEAVYNAKEEWERTFDSVPDLIAIMDDQHRVVRVNRAMAQRLGLRPEECVGLPCYAAIHGTTEPPAFCPHTMTLADRQEHEAEVSEEALGGDFLISTTPLLDAAGKLIGTVHVARDITARKQAEQALRASEEKVRRKLESILSPEGEIGDLDLADLIDASPMQSLMDNFYELTHMPMGMIDLKGNILVGVGWQDICTKFHRIHPETCKNCIESDTQLTTGVPQGEFKLYKCKNNMWDVSTPIIVGGKHLGNFFMGQFFFEDEPVDYEFFRGQAKQYGFDEDEYLRCLERVPRLSRETLATGMAYFMELAEMISRTSYSNLKLARSLAERDALMASLQENEERLKRAQEISRLGSWELDLAKDRLTWSDEVYRIFGLQPQEFAATYEAFLAAVHPDDRNAVDAAYSSSLREGRDTYEIEHRIVRKPSGEVRIVLEKCEHFRDSSGQIVRSIGMVHDITESKQVEEELRRAKETAEAATRTKSQFLANMSHELRTPMTGVLGTLDLALAGDLAAEQRKYIAMAQTSARSLVRILNDILDLTKIEMGKLSLEEKSFPIRKCLANTYNLFLPVAKGKGLNLSLTVADEVPETLVGDQTRISQILTNLIGNAVKFTEKGEVALRVTAGDCTAAGKQEVTITVTDTGIGIPDDKKNLLFQVFSQVDESHSREYGGTGLGLAISKEIVERMGGKISFCSAAGKGSTFSCIIPFAVAKAGGAVGSAVEKTAPAGEPRRAEETRRPRLLIAEDDQIISQILKALLQRSNYDLDFVDNGEKAVEMWKNGGYDLILMDVQMPRLNGFEATAAIREKERSCGGHIPIIAMTAHALKEDEERCLAAGMDAYISKPIDFKRTLQVVEEILRQKPGSF